MIIEMLLTLIKNVLNILLVFEIPPLPDEVWDYFYSFFDYVTTGASILANYTPLSYLMTLFFFIVSVDLAIFVYKFVMWVIRKIPMLNVS